MESGYVNFRKAKVGGFNKKDVINYIEKMRNDFYDYKNAVEATIDRLNAKINELEMATNTEPEQQIKEVIVEVPVASENANDPLADINEATSQLRMVADELCRNLSDFISKINNDNTAECKKSEKTEIFDDVGAYIEETAKGIFESKSDEAVCADVETEPEETVDKVAAILSVSSNFSFMKDDISNSDEKVTHSQPEKKSILDSLSSSAFFN